MTTFSAKPLWRSLWPAFAVLVSMQAAATTYNVVTLPGTTDTQAVQVFGINNAGQVAGGYANDSGQQAFIYSAGSFTNLSGPSGALGASAFGISDTGLVVGSYYDTKVIDPATGTLVKGPDRGFVFDGTNYVALNVPGADATQIRAVSPNGRYASGFATDAAGAISGFVYDRNTSAFTNVSRPTSLFPLAQGVNNAGVVVGSDIVAVPGAPSQRVGFTYDLNTGTRTDYSFAGYTRTAFRDIDESGRIAGWLQGLLPGGQVGTIGFIGTPSSYELFAVPGQTVTNLQSFNNAGTLVGTYVDAAGLTYAFVATPVPEPPTALLMMAGAVACLAWQRRRAHRS